jgi:hypothetical protein
MAKWNSVVGDMVMYHGAIEFMSLQWIAALSEDLVLHNVAVDLRFAKRIEIIQMLIERADWAKNRKQQAALLWKEAASLLEKRNKLVHNPICTRTNSEGKIEIGIIDSKKMRRTDTLAIIPFSRGEIADIGNRLCKLFQRLQEFSV